MNDLNFMQLAAATIGSIMLSISVAFVAYLKIFARKHSSQSK